MVANVPQMPVVSLPMPTNNQMPGQMSVPRCQANYSSYSSTFHSNRFEPLSVLLPPTQPPSLGSRPPIVGQFDQPPPPPTSVQMFLPLVHQTPPPGPSPISGANQSQPLLMPQLHQNSQMGVRLGPVPQLPQQMMSANQPFPNAMPGPPFPPTHIPPNNQFFNAVPNSGPIAPKEVIPDVPYFELPAGLMAPLVKLEDFEYKPIVPRDIRLPPPAPPNERLLAAVEMFYAPPTHERPRNSDGWEQLGLYEFFKAKSHAKKLKEESKNSIESTDTSNNMNQNVVKINSNNSENDSKSNQNTESHSHSSSHSKRSPSPKRKYREYREDKRYAINKYLSSFFNELLLKSPEIQISSKSKPFAFQYEKKTFPVSLQVQI